MKFSLVAVTLSALAAAVVANPIERRTGAILITGDVRMITEQSSQLTTVAQQISITNAFQFGPQIVAGFSGIYSSASTAIGHCNSGDRTPFSDDEGNEFIAVLTEFVRVHQVLLNVIIGKHGFLAQFGFAEPVRQALVALEAGVDAFALAFIDLIPHNVDDAMVQHGELTASLNSTIAVYSM